jgi:hypothetical protein
MQMTRAKLIVDLQTYSTTASNIRKRVLFLAKIKEIPSSLSVVKEVSVAPNLCK